MDASREIEMDAIRLRDAVTDNGATGRRAARAIPTLLILLVTAAAILAAAFLSDRGASASAAGGMTAVSVTGTASGAAPVIGKPAPDFTATTTDGRQVSLSDYVGHPVWLTFGASWCQPCRAENPDVEAAYRSFQDRGIVVLQVYMSEDAASVRDYAGRVGITYVTVPDPDERLSAEYRILGIPSHFFIDASGKLVRMKIGSLDPQSMRAALEAITG